MAIIQSPRGFQRFSFFLLVYAVIIIVWGAFVRISGSGDGCGQHWPLCHGEFYPTGSVAEALQTWIELFHRLKSSIFGFLMIGAVFWVRRIYPSHHGVRRVAGIALMATIVEGLLGAALVKFQWVDQDRSVGRVIVMALHLTNTLFLTGLLVLQTVWSGYQTPRFSLHSRKQLLFAGSAIVGFLLVGVTGAWAALSGTLYPTHNLWEGLQSDFRTESPLLVRLRIFHPVAALLVASLLVAVHSQLSEYTKHGAAKLTIWFIPILMFGILFGAATLFLHSPDWMKLTHLLLANVIWACLIFLISTASTVESKSPNNN